MAREATAPVSPAASAMVVTNSQLRPRRLRGGGAGVSEVAEMLVAHGALLQWCRALALVQMWGSFVSGASPECKVM